MNESQRETLSAMLDNEADDLELRRLLKDAADPELLQAWQRYGAAQALLRGERLTRLGPNFREEISRRLANEPAPRGGRAAAGRGRRFVGKIAIAASVALAVFIGMQAGLNDGRDNPPAAQIAADAPSIQPRPVRTANEAAAPTPQVVEVADTPAVPVDPEARQRLLEYIGRMRFNPEEPPRVEHIQDSPLYHLVNDLQD